MKSDNAAHVGKHCFERAGLGYAPFKFIGMHTQVYQACPGAPMQAGTSCDYCGTGIMYVCTIQDALGATFKVGCDCVAKTGDTGLIKAYKHAPEVRKAAADKREVKHQKNVAEIRAILSDPVQSAMLASIPRTTWNGETEPTLDFINRVIYQCGAAGIARYLKFTKKLLAENKTA